MKLSLSALILIATILLAGCGKEDDESVTPGYLKPGEFRPKGIIEKGYTFTDPIFTGGDGTCSGEECLAAYALWSTDNIPVEGVAVKDNDSVDSRLLLKMTRVKGTQWSIKLTYKGKAYLNKAVPASSIDLSICTTDVRTLPEYTSAESGDLLDASETFLVKATITVVATTIELKTDEDTPETIELIKDDEIIAQAFSSRGAPACP
jgi:hypothetical protein